MDLKRAPELQQYHQESIRLTGGDWVRATRTMPDQDLRTGERYKVEAVDRGSVRVVHSAESVELSRTCALHLDSGYASTVHSAQGTTVNPVLIDVDTKSATARLDAHYVAIARPKQELRAFADDTDHLLASTTRDLAPAKALDVDVASNQDDMTLPLVSGSHRRDSKRLFFCCAASQSRSNFIWLSSPASDANDGDRRNSTSP